MLYAYRACGIGIASRMDPYCRLASSYASGPAVANHQNRNRLRLAGTYPFEFHNQAGEGHLSSSGTFHQGRYDTPGGNGGPASRRG